MTGETEKYGDFVKGVSLTLMFHSKTLFAVFVSVLNMKQPIPRLWEFTHIWRHDASIKRRENQHVEQLEAEGLELLELVDGEAYTVHPIPNGDSVAKLGEHSLVVSVHEPPPLRPSRWKARKGAGGIEALVTSILGTICRHYLEPHFDQHSAYRHWLSRLGKNA